MLSSGVHARVHDDFFLTFFEEKNQKQTNKQQQQQKQVKPPRGYHFLRKGVSNILGSWPWSYLLIFDAQPPKLSLTHIVYGPVTETLHPPGDFWRPLFLETLAIGLLKSGCLQKSQCWIKPWGRFFQNGRQISTNVLFLILFFVFRQF